jgi:hypothetical protein
MDWEYEIADTGRSLSWSPDPWLVFEPTNGQRNRAGDIVRRHWNTRWSPNLFPLPFAWSGMYVLGGQSVHVDGTQEWSFSLNVPDPGTFWCQEIWAGVPIGFYQSYRVALRGRDELTLYHYPEHRTPYFVGNGRFVDEVPEAVSREIEDRAARLERWIGSLKTAPNGPVPTVYTRTAAPEDLSCPTQCPVCLTRTPSHSCKCVPYWGKPEEYPSWAGLQETLGGATWNSRKALWEKMA